MKKPSFTWPEKAFFLFGIMAATLFFVWAGMLQKPRENIIQNARAGDDQGIQVSVSSFSDRRDDNQRYEVLLRSSDDAIACRETFVGGDKIATQGTCSHTYYYPATGVSLDAVLLQGNVTLYPIGWQCRLLDTPGDTTGVGGSGIGSSHNATSIYIPFSNTDTLPPSPLLPSSKKMYVNCRYEFAGDAEFDLDYVLDGDPIYVVEQGDSIDIPFSLRYTQGTGETVHLSVENGEMLEENNISLKIDPFYCTSNCTTTVTLGTSQLPETPLGDYALTLQACHGLNTASNTCARFKELPFTLRVIKPTFFSVGRVPKPSTPTPSPRLPQPTFFQR